MRPLLSGAVSGSLAWVLLLILVRKFGSVAGAFGGSGLLVFLVTGVLGVTGGILYGAIFRRAANDPRGSWLLGICFGFLLWNLNPLIWVPYFGGEALLVGQPALLFLVGHVLWGGLCGVLHPILSRVSARPLPD
jgi:hypothetical protein